MLSRHDDGWAPLTIGPARPPPEQWHIFTDGSFTPGVRGEADVAGWGVAVFRHGETTGSPEFVLYGPVVVDDSDLRSLGAVEASNNTGELQAIGEALLWILNEAPDPTKVPVDIHYDSEYAANMAQ
jgi:ribonuclease HI